MRVVQESETEYEKGDVIAFTKDYSGEDQIYLGIIESGYPDEGDTWWFDVRVSHNEVFCYSNYGDIPEYDILGIIKGELADRVKNVIIKETE